MKKLAIKNQELATMYQESVEVGTEDAGDVGAYPMVKITTKMSDNKLFDGKSSKIGKLYHTELKQEFSEIEANVCYMGKFQLPDFNNPEVLKQTYVLGCVKKDDNTPFVAYVKGMSLQNMWSLQGEVGNIKNRFKIPMYALSITIKVGSRKSDKFGDVNVFEFEVERGDDATPVFEADFERAKSLKELIKKFKDVVKAMNRKGEEDSDPYIESVNEERKADQVAEDAMNAIGGKR